jgi:hypothetical protein
MVAHVGSAVTGSDFDPLSEDAEDLPITLRREKEARAREARERAAQERAAAPTLSMGTGERPRPQPQIYASADFSHGQAADPAQTFVPATVRDIDMPFQNLVLFFLKAVLASIPALILLTAMLWSLGALLELAFPWLIKMKILISFPN